MEAEQAIVDAMAWLGLDYDEGPYYQMKRMDRYRAVLDDMETHPDPDKALSDGPNAWPLGRMRALLETLKELDATVKRAGFPEQQLMHGESGRAA